jgi:signal transduction histidine kinase
LAESSNSESGGLAPFEGDPQAEKRKRKGFFRRMPIRWRIALGSALVGLLVLGVFSLVVGLLSAAKLQENFHNEVTRGADSVQRVLNNQIAVLPGRPAATCATLKIVMADDDADARIFAWARSQLVGSVNCSTSPRTDRFGLPDTQPQETNGYYIETRLLNSKTKFRPLLQYGRPVADVQSSIDDINKILIGSVLVGTLLIFLASWIITRIALSPLRELTEAAKEIEQTLSASKGLSGSEAAGELVELSTTMDSMVRALEGSRTTNQALLVRQREFLAEASHELGTPLTSLLANLEYIIDHLEGEPGEAGQSAFRSALRLKTLVSDLMVLARTDTGRPVGSEEVDMATIVTEAVTEIKPLREEHQIELKLDKAVVLGTSDDLYRLVLNLLSNAVRHTPPGTKVEVSTTTDGDTVELIIEDDGPGIPPAIAANVFDRFVKGRSSRKGSSGLGLAIVKAVAETHSGTVRLEQSAKGKGARFVVDLPAAKSVSGTPPTLTES